MAKKAKKVVSTRGEIDPEFGGRRGGGGDGCPQPCRRACPVKAFDHAAYSSAELGQSILPGINGTYDRVTCNTKMSRDVDEAARAMAASDEEGESLASTMNAFEDAVLAMPKGDGDAQYGVRYCRMCELSCPVGRRAKTR